MSTLWICSACGGLVAHDFVIAHTHFHSLTGVSPEFYPLAGSGSDGDTER